MSAANFAALLAERGVSAVGWDWDQTAIRWHSGGRVEGTPSERESILRDACAPDFLEAFQMLGAAGFKQAIVTFSDAKHSRLPPKQDSGIRETPLRRPSISGEAMVREVLQLNTNSTHTETPVFALFPLFYKSPAEWKPLGLPGPAPPHKRWHLDQMCQAFNLEPSQICLVDDDPDNIEDALNHGFNCVRVEGSEGFSFKDMRNFCGHH